MTREEKELLLKDLSARLRYYDDCSELVDWLNAHTHHFDYRGLIPMGLALPAKDGMYETEN